MELSDVDARNAAALMHSSYWTQYYRPRLEIEFKKRLESLALESGKDDDIKRGYVRALNWALTFPQRDIDEYNRALEEQKAAEADAAESSVIAERGFNSPYVEGGKEH